MLYAGKGRLKYCYNFFGIHHYFTEADIPIPAGKHQVRMEFRYDGGGLAKGGGVILYNNGKPVGKGRVDQTQPMGYSADEACDVGADTGSPTSPEYAPEAMRLTVRFTGYKSISAPTVMIISSRPRSISSLL